jgi:hypothetical protein
MASKRSRASLQTFHALQASDLAAAMNDAMKKVRIGPGDYAPELTAPEGQSTAGGVQAMQHLRLVPGQTGQPTLVMGHANHAAGKAELRTYEHLDAIHRRRFKRPLGLDRARYEECLTLAQHVLDGLHLETSIAGPPADLADEPASGPQKRGTSKMAVAIMVAVALAAAGLTIWTLLRGRGG